MVPTLRSRRTALIVGSIAALIAVVVFSTSRMLAATPPSTYRTQAVQTANVSQTVAVSGTVNALTQVRLSFKQSGRLAAIPVAVGQTVKADDVLAKLDDADQQVTLQQASANLASARAKYQVTLAGDELAALRLSVDNAQKTLDRLTANYNAAKANVDLLYDSAKVDRASAQTAFDSAQTHLRALRDALKFLGSLADGKTAAASATLVQGNVAQAVAQFGLLDTALVELASMSGAIKAQAGSYDAGSLDATTFVLAQASYSGALTRAQAAVDATSATLTTALTNANAILATFATTDIVPTEYYLSISRPEANSLVADLSTTQGKLQLVKSKLGALNSSLATIADAVTGSGLSTAQSAVATAKQSLQAKLGSRDSDIQSALATVQSAQASFESAKNAVANMTLTAPMSGVVASISGNVGEFASGTPNSPFILLTAASGIALHGTVGEADVARLKVGQPAMVTIDAIGTGRRITGKVTSLDPVATIQQGVPVYGVDVTIDLSDPAVRAGMSGTANIVTASKQGVLVVPNIAIRSLGGRRGVQVLRDGQPVDVTDVQFGLSNDQVTEVTSGLAQGDLVLLPSARANPSAQIRFGPGGPAPGGGPPGR